MCYTSDMKPNKSLFYQARYYLTGGITIMVIAGAIVFFQPQPSEIRVAQAQTAGSSTPPDQGPPQNVGLPLPGGNVSSSSSVSVSSSSSSSSSLTQSQNVQQTGGSTPTNPTIDPTQVTTVTPRSGGLGITVLLITLITFGGVYYFYRLKNQKDKLATKEKKIV
jgi:hypothetical protein